MHRFRQPFHSHFVYFSKGIRYLELSCQLDTINTLHTALPLGPSAGLTLHTDQILCSDLVI